MEKFIITEIKDYIKSDETQFLCKALNKFEQMLIDLPKYERKHTIIMFLDFINICSSITKDRKNTWQEIIYDCCESQLMLLDN